MENCFKRAIMMATLVIAFTCLLFIQPQIAAAQYDGDYCGVGSNADYLANWKMTISNSNIIGHGCDNDGATSTFTGSVDSSGRFTVTDDDGDGRCAGTINDSGAVTGTCTDSEGTMDINGAKSAGCTSGCEGGGGSDGGGGGCFAGSSLRLE